MYNITFGHNDAVHRNADGVAVIGFWVRISSYNNSLRRQQGVSHNIKMPHRMCDLLSRDYQCHVDGYRAPRGGAKAVRNPENDAHLAGLQESIDILATIQAKDRRLIPIGSIN